ncbi:hypothetical protein L2E82_36594 [Cichorium intybus]|uniref:Uncharacterized protein n=1 Tax=Cichorium intybus TaxID=13427 RepID=A0ACB9AEJ2_CICIN|nr:hypothetical protein L2E82_36594 [Cichorium intybus]
MQYDVFQVDPLYSKDAYTLVCLSAFTKAERTPNLVIDENLVNQDDENIQDVKHAVQYQCSDYDSECERADLKAYGYIAGESGIILIDGIDASKFPIDGRSLVVSVVGIGLVPPPFPPHAG